MKITQPVPRASARTFTGKSQRSRLLSLKKIMISAQSSLFDALKVINDAPQFGMPSGIAIVTSKNGVIQGTVTDGDIRRALLKKMSLETEVSHFMVNDPILIPHQFSGTALRERVDFEMKAKKRMRSGRPDRIILVDDKNRLVDILNDHDIRRNEDIWSKQICIIGMGYVGLTLSIVMADAGLNVWGIDINRSLISMLKKGRSHFHETGLNAVLRRVIGDRLQVSVPKDFQQADVYILAVSTPVDHKNKPQLDHLISATQEVASRLKRGDTVMIRSTVPVGTSREVILPILEKISGMIGGRDFYLAFAPERTLEGKALEELRTLPQVIGGLNEVSAEEAERVFHPFAKSIVQVDSLEEAEMVKLINNSFRDVIFGYANEMSQICGSFKINAARIIEAANRGYPRDRIPLPSPGVGGTCLKKDPYILMASSQKRGLTSNFSKLAREVNQAMPRLVANQIIRFLRSKKKNLKQSHVFILGFAFKGHPETSDMRGSITTELIEHLKKYGIHIRGYDPVVTATEIRKVGALPCSLTKGVAQADALVIMNNHQSFANLDIAILLEKMRRPALFFDGWNLFHAAEIKRIQGITYSGVGFES